MRKPTLCRFLTYLFAVPHCAACRVLISPEEALSGIGGADVLCSACRAKWEQEKLKFCVRCGNAALDCRCMPEQLRQAGAETLVHLGEYRSDNAIGQTVLRMKDTALRRASRFSAAQLAFGVRRVCADLSIPPSSLTVTYLPRTVRAVRERGHDQAELVSRALANELGAEFAPLLLRVKDGITQKTLTAAERRRNVRAAFAHNTDTDCRGRTILLFDDVVTSGASMAECVRVLRKAGAAAVLCVSIGVGGK